MAIVGYARVSSAGQNLDRQTDALASVSVEKMFIDKVSGKDAARAGLKELRSYVREGDTVYVASFDRLARSLSDLLAIVAEFNNAGVRLVSLKESLDTATPQGKLMLSLFGAFAEFERTIIVERGTDGIKAARDRGVVFGRPRTEKPEGFDKAVRRWKAGQATAVETFTALGLSKTMFYKMVKESKKAVK